MQRVEANVGEGENAPLAHDVQKLARAVATWAAERPILSDVALFGERLRAGHRNAPLQIAVRYDDQRMIEGFDDWIEQLRTNFSGLSAMVGQRVDVLTPENRGDWEAAVHGPELSALGTGKVRIVIEKCAASAPVPTRHRSARFGSSVFRSWALTAAQPLAPGRG